MLDHAARIPFPTPIGDSGEERKLKAVKRT
jgi:hypothetical protein